MAITILENNAVDITNIDGMAFNNFSAGNRDGIVGGYLNECAISSTGNSVLLSTGCLLLRGVRINISEVESVVISSTPSTDTRYQLIAQIERDSNKTFSWSLFVQTPINLIKADIINSEGIYQLEVGRFTHTTLGTITDIIRTADILYGGASITADINVGNVTTDILAPGIDAEIDIDKRVEDKKTYLDFKFSLPATAGTAVTVGGIEQTSWNADTKVDASGPEMLKLAGIEAGAQVNPTPVNNLISTSIELPLAANQGRALDVSKADADITGMLPNLTITASSDVRRVYGKNVSGTVSGSAELYLVNCTGSVTISGNNAKIYAFNCPALTISGITASNWQNVYRDGRAEYRLNLGIAITISNLTINKDIYTMTGLKAIADQADSISLPYNIVRNGWSSMGGVTKTTSVGGLYQFHIVVSLQNGGVPVTAEFIIISLLLGENSFHTGLAACSGVGSDNVHFNELIFERYL